MQFRHEMQEHLTAGLVAKVIILFIKLCLPAPVLFVFCNENQEKLSVFSSHGLFLILTRKRQVCPVPHLTVTMFKEVLNSAGQFTHSLSSSPFSRINSMCV